MCSLDLGREAVGLLKADSSSNGFQVQKKDREQKEIIDASDQDRTGDLRISQLSWIMHMRPA